MIVAFSVTPMGGSESVGESVAECVRIVRAAGLPHETNAMFTNVEGEWDEIQAVLKQCLDRLAETAPRVSMVVKVDHRPGAGDGRIEHKRRRVAEALGESDAEPGIGPAWSG